MSTNNEKDTENDSDSEYQQQILDEYMEPGTVDPNSSQDTNEQQDLTNNEATQSQDTATSDSDKHQQDQSAKEGEVSPDSFDVPHPLFREYLAHGVNEGTISESTARKNYSTALRGLAEYLEKEGIDVLDAELLHIKSYLSYESGRLRKSTLNRYASAIREAYLYIIALHDVDINLNYASLMILDVPDSDLESATRESLSRQEIKELLDAIKRPRDKLMILIGLYLGPRNGAIRKIKLNDVDLDDEEITLLDEKSNETYTLPLPSKLVTYLDHWINTIRLENHPEAKDSPYLFPSREGGTLTSKHFSSIVREAADEAGIQETIYEIEISGKQQDIFGTDTRSFYKVTPHTLRHTFNELLKDKGLDLETRSEFLNHDNTEITREYYDDEIEIINEALEDLVEF